MSAKFIAHAPEGFERDQGAPGIRGNRHGKTVNDNISARNTIMIRGLVDSARDLDSAVRGLRNALFVESQSDENTAVFMYERHDGLDGLLLSVD